MSMRIIPAILASLSTEVTGPKPKTKTTILIRMYCSLISARKMMDNSMMKR
jgi:hypothetical protein